MSDSTMLVVAVLGAAVVGAAILLLVNRYVRKVSGAATIENGIRATATVETIGDSGVTVSSSKLGGEAQVHQLGLMVRQPGREPYLVRVRQAVPQVAIPMLVVGAEFPVKVDPEDPQRVGIDWRYFVEGADPVRGWRSGTAVIERMAETETTISAPRVGPDAVVYEFGLRVLPRKGAAYHADVKWPVPRTVRPRLAAGAEIDVRIDDRNPSRVAVEWETLRPGSSPASRA